jgi:eukaryotic-like serine/threonine-protein kinase
MNNDEQKNKKKQERQHKADSGRLTVSFQASAGAQIGQIGSYKLLSVLGEGGFSVVYLAEQDRPVKRLVALKVIKPGMDTKQVIARFEAERQTLALLNHPNIAAVYDAGATETGLPYFVMENVKGIPITEHCDREKLSIEERLALFLQVCDGVQYAHQKGIIHRDIKPSNILVSFDGDKAAPRIIDFGVSKAITKQLSERTLYTEQGQFVGTPEYMSPEQAEMGAQDIDTRTDIYSMGVVLYELLTGALPFDPEALRESSIENIRRIIREQDPKKPSTRLTGMGEEARKIAENRNIDLANLKKRLNRELEWIPLKAMRKDRTRRYRSASEFADDIRNYLNGRPLIAGPESAVYRLKKFALRNRTLLTGIAAVLIVLIAGIIVSTNFGIRASRARKEADAARIKAEQESRTAQAISDFLRKDLLESMDPYVRPEQQEISVRSWLDETTRKLDGRFQNEPFVEAQIRYSLGKTYRNLGTRNDLERAEKLLLRASALQTQVLGEKAIDTLNTKELLGSVYMRMGRYLDAQTPYEQTLEGRREVLGPNAPDTLSAMNELGLLYSSLGRYSKAEDLYLKALPASHSVFGENDAFTLLLTGNLATIYRYEGRYEDSEKLYNKVKEDLFNRIKQNPNLMLDNENPDTLYYILSSMNGLGKLYINEKRYDDAEYFFRIAQQTGSKVLGADHPDILNSINGLGLVYTAKSDFSRAEYYLNDNALYEIRTKLGEDNPTTLTCLYCLGWLKYNEGNAADKAGDKEKTKKDYDNADEYLTKALSGRQNLLGYDHPDTLETKNALALLYKALGKFSEAKKILEETLSDRKATLGEKHPDTLETQQELDDLEKIMSDSQTDTKTEDSTSITP